MGKIRMKTVGSDDDEKKQQLEAEKRREAKKQKKAEQAAPVEASEEVEEVVVEEKKDKKKNKKSSSETQKAGRHTGKKYIAAKKLAEDGKRYSLDEALSLLKKAAYASFDESVEVHMNLVDTSVKGEVAFPHGTGKQVRVVVASDDVLAKVDAGVIDFDILIASPSFMPKLVKYARVLGPKGLMPNPKNGTVVEDTKKAVEKFQTGSVRIKSEAKFPLLHLSVGKKSFEDKALVENIKALMNVVQKKNVQMMFVSSTMGPSFEVDFQSL